MSEERPLSPCCSARVWLGGFSRSGKRKYICINCRRRFTDPQLKKGFALPNGERVGITRDIFDQLVVLFWEGKTVSEGMTSTQIPYGYVKRVYRALRESWYGNFRIEPDRAFGVCRNPECKNEFTNIVADKDRVYCSAQCALTNGRVQRINQLDEATLKQLYLDENRSGTKIARLYNTNPTNVYRWLRYYGIPVRKHTVVENCIEPGCGQPVEKKYHSAKKSWYGRRCEDHQRFHEVTKPQCTSSVEREEDLAHDAER